MLKAKTLLYYYLILTAVFLGGRMYIMETYHMKQGPVPPEAFHRLMEWVNLFSYFYIIPLWLVGLISLIRFSRRRNYSVVLTILLCVLYVWLTVMAAIFIKFVFLITFYGFAP
ncbi:hypothetical protein [Brevibacillus sp. SYSU BS000544]|uniref:hypothetical protein n=1 Tax=Brevibacillus sp. SYSU BS000544 TaxID=3416443 RepID=UPI003CE4F556